MKILVVGSGAVGGYFGGRLCQAGYNVTFLARGAQLSALQKSGLTIKSINGDFRSSVQAEEKAEGLFDLVFFAVKAHDLDPAAEQVKDNVGKETSIVSLLNGIDSEKKMGEQFGAEKIIGGIAFIGSTVSLAGVIEHTAAGAITIGELDGTETSRCVKIKEMFTKATVPCKISTHIQKDIWIKMAWNVGFNALTAITDTLVSDILAHPQTTTLVEQTISETLQVAQAEGIMLSQDLADTTISKTKKAGAIKTSMQQDIRNGRKTEIEAINGTVVRLGKAHGIPTPVNETLCNLISFKERA